MEMDAGEIDYIAIRPDKFGWSLWVYAGKDGVHVFDIGDAIQFHGEVDRTIGRWLADGPADFHAARTDSTEPTHYVKEDTRP